VLALVAGCLPEPERPPFEFVVRVESDPREPLAGALVRHAGVDLGVSSPSGALRVRARGQEGERLTLNITCPAGFRSPERPTTVTLRRAAETARRAEYLVACPPEKRKVVIAVRATHGANLPVKVLEREVARTDASGAAHVVLAGSPEETLELTLDTSAEPRLRPKSPSARFAVGTRDEIVVYNQSFELASAPAPRRSHRPMPLRIQ
jgi:hypothetical protein